MELYKNYEISAMSLAQAKKEYQRMRKIAIKRLKRLQKNDRLDYIEDIPDLPRMSKINANRLYRELMEVNRFLKNPFTLINQVKAFEKDLISKFHESGYEFVNMDNIKYINRLMGIIRDKVGDKAFESDEALEYIEQIEKLNMDPADFAKSIDELMKLSPGQLEQLARLNVDPKNLTKRADEFAEFTPAQLEQLKPIRTGREMKYIDVKNRIEKYGL